MPIEDTVVERINELLHEAQHLRQSNQHGQVRGDQHAQECKGWLAAALNIVEIVVPEPDAGYRKMARDIASRDYGYVIQEGVGELAAVLSNLLRDAQAGLVASVADQARAEVFDDFLDHAKAYQKENRKNEAGVIAGVVFEDSIRRVCRKLEIEERGRNLDGLISDLAKSGVLSGTKAKRARVAADVRTKATHAQWDDFDDGDLRTTIEFTEEIISNYVEE